MSQMKAVQDLLLTNVSSAFIPQGLIADSVLPVVPSVQSTGKLGVYGTNHLRIETNIKGGRGAYPRVESMTRSTSSYSIEGHGLEGLVTLEDYKNAQAPFDAEADEVLGITSLLAIAKEKGLADTLTSTAILTQNTTLAGIQQFSDYDNSDPFSVFATGRSAIKSGCGIVDDMVAIVPWEVFNKLKYHPQFLDALGYKQSRPGGLKEAELADILEVRAIYVPKGSYESAKEGQSTSLAAIWGKHIVFAVLPVSAQKYQVSAGYMFKYANEAVRQVSKYVVNNPRGAKGILVDDHYDMVISNAKAAYLIKDAIA